MSHPDEGVLQELLDGELAPADAAVVRAHLAGCPPCTAAFDELKALQADADAIVARLPLDPPLARPARRAAPRRAPNLRLIGLAASAVLVAGTSWMIFRASQGPYMLTARDADTGSGIALPMPTEERKELESTTPAAAPPREALKQEAAEKDANADRRANAAEPADAPAPTAGAAAPPAAARLAPGAMQRAAIAPTTVAEAEARLGTRVRTIDGLTPLSVEVLPPTADSVTTVEQRYLVSGVTVVLMQRMSPAVSRDEVSAKAREPAPYVDGVGVQPGKRANGFVAAADSGELQPAIRTWEAWGSLFQLRGALPADSIDALMKRVK